MDTTQDKQTPHRQQLGKVEIQNMIRPYVPDMILAALEMVKKADNDSVRLGAIKLLLSKVVPDLKAVDVDGEAINKIFERLIIERPNGDK